MISLSKMEGIRYVGDRDALVVHDTWNNDSEGCRLGDLLGRGEAVSFEPDTLEQAFDEGFDYCDDCIGASDPDGPPASWSTAAAS
ncbi:MAG: hypothetical protein ABIG03_01955 [Candidatus Eisenbacteria bacterium]